MCLWLPLTARLAHSPPQVRDIAGDDAPALRQALKQLAHDKVPGSEGADGLNGLTGGNCDGGGVDGAAAPLGVKHDVDMTPADGSAPAGAGVNGDANLCQPCAPSGASDASGKPGEGLSSAAGGASTAAASSSSGAAPVAASSGLGSAAATTAAAGGSSSSGGASSSGQPQQRQQQQRLEVAAAAVLVHAASCSDAACPVPHCNKMKKIHAHFLECTTSDCAICKKLRPLTYIHAKHCHTVPGEQCVIPYCARAKKELQALMSRNQNAQRSAGGGSSSGDARAGQPMGGGMPPGVGAPMMGANGVSWNGAHGGLAGLDSQSVQAQAHYLLVLAHVMKCANTNCSVAECGTTKALVTNHTRSCRAGDACTYPRCALSKRLMRHHRECPDQNCPVCLPLRRRLQAAKMNVQASQPSGSGEGGAPAPKGRSKAKRRKEDGEPTDENGNGGGAAGGVHQGPPSKRKRKNEGAAGGGSKKGKANAAAAAEAEQQIVQEVDMLESGFSVSVHFPSHRRASSENSGEWRPGTVLRAYMSPTTLEPVYDIMLHSGVEEKAMAHERCRMVCNVCLADKRAFKPPPMFCEKCFQAIHSRWSYWEESGDEGGVKLCKRCFSDLKATSTADRVLSEIAHRSVKLDNFSERKEKDRPEYVDNWVQCDECHSWQHWTCAMYKGEDTPEDCLFFCRSCRKGRAKELPKELKVAPSHALPDTVLSKKLQLALSAELDALGVKFAPVTIRVVSNIDCLSKIAPPPPLPGTAAAHSAAKGAKGAGGKLALQNGKVGMTEFPYRSKCILAFQRMGRGAEMGEGPEVCFFAMYVQEYGSDCPEPNTNRVYISYLDSVRYFVSSPEGHRTTVYHSILINYLDYARELGFEHGHIWVSPPKQGDDYIFYAHPEAMLQKRMGLLKLKEWYEKMLLIARERKVINDFQDMLDAYKDIESASDIPVFAGDHWAASIALKIQELKNKEKELAKKKGGGGKSAKSGGGGGGGVHAEIKQEEALLNQIKEEMTSMRNHFIVVQLAEQRVEGQHNKVVDPVPIISNEFVDKRSSFLEKCQMYHWQFDEVRCAADAPRTSRHPATVPRRRHGLYCD